MGVLRDRMIEEMKLRNFSPATQQSYVYAVSRLAKYHHKSPDQLSKEDIRAFLVHLTVKRKLSPNSLTGYCSGLRFFYNETLGWDETKLFIPPRKKSSPLPEVFSPSEVLRVIDGARGLKQRVLLMTAYSAGLRVGELVSLKITDIDAARMTIRVKQDIQNTENRCLIFGLYNKHVGFSFWIAMQYKNTEKEFVFETL